MDFKESSSDFLKVCRGERSDRTPVWFMRQAGRFNPEHRELYEEHGVRGITTTPELNARVTCLPVETFGVDAAVMYADIILPLEDMGIEFHYGEGDVGPIMETSINKRSDLDGLRKLEPSRGVPYILEAIELAQEELPEDVPLIGFSGGPFTLAGYVLEEEASRTFPRTKKIMHQNPELFHEFMELLTESIIDYLKAKIEAGVDVIQLFDSWMGVLSPADYRRNVHQYTERIFTEIGKFDLNVPTIHFGTNTFGLLKEQVDSGADVIGVDWRMNFNQVEKSVGSDHIIMGNLDPSVVLTNQSIIEKEISRILREAEPFKGHIFNLGHRVPNGAPVENLRYIVDCVHELTQK